MAHGRRTERVWRHLHGMSSIHTLHQQGSRQRVRGSNACRADDGLREVKFEGILAEWVEVDTIEIGLSPEVRPANARVRVLILQPTQAPLAGRLPCYDSEGAAAVHTW